MKGVKSSHRMGVSKKDKGGLPKHNEKIAIVGAGLMGRGIGQSFASAGYRVTLIDLNQKILDFAVRQIGASLKVMEKAGLIKGKSEGVLDHLSTEPVLSKGVSDSSFVIEAVFENIDTKKEVFKKVEASVSPETIISSNTTAIPITSLASVTTHPERVVGSHFWNPPQLMRAVEVTKGEKTSPATVEKIVSILRNAGKKPAVVNKDVPGQIGIRILYAMIREATWLVENGVASADDVDSVVKEALGTRLEVVGPLELSDLSGIDLVENVAKILYKSLDSSQGPQELVKNMVKRGELGVKSGKGFYDWKKERNAQETIKLRDEHLIKILKEKMSSKDSS
jgi:3-hydroxyacyl-CoA dehydrogenase